MIDVSKCCELINDKNNILVVSHIRPDGDTLGSGAALTHALNRLGKTAYLFRNVQVTDKYLPYVKAYFAPENFVPDYIIAVDTASDSMFAIGFEGKVDLCIDHHPSNSKYADNLLLKGEKAACGEIILEIIKELCGNIDFTEAELLYIAISTDTGCFNYSNTSSDTFRAAAELLDAGIDINTLNTKFFRKVSKERIVLEGLVYQNMKYYMNNKVVFAVITKKMMEESGATENDCDDLANLATRLDTEIVGVTVKEQDDGSCKISVRSGPEFNSSDLCAMFGGGGHAMAAGCRIDGTPDNAISIILSEIEKVGI